MRPGTLGLAVTVASAMAAMGQDAEVVHRTPSDAPGLGGWLARNNRHRFPKGPKAKPVRRARLQRATGPGSYDEWKKELAAERAAKRAARA